MEVLVNEYTKSLSDKTDTGITRPIHTQYLRIHIEPVKAYFKQTVLEYQNIIAMKYAILLFCLFALVLSCKKDELPLIPTAATHVFFKNQSDMHQKIQSLVTDRYPAEHLQEITHVSYIDSRDKSYALVFYKTEKRSGNLLIGQTFEKGTLVSTSTGTCEGVGCNCQVVTTISSSGDVKISCSCSSCTMLVNETVTATSMNP